MHPGFPVHNPGTVVRDECTSVFAHIFVALGPKIAVLVRIGTVESVTVCGTGTRISIFVEDIGTKLLATGKRPV